MRTGLAITGSLSALKIEAEVVALTSSLILRLHVPASSSSRRNSTPKVGALREADM